MRRIPGRPLLTPLVLLALLGGAPACRSANRDDRPRVAARRADLITLDEIEKRSWNSLYEVVATLRPNWLHDRGPDTVNMAQVEIQAVIDDVRMGGVRVLESTPVPGVQSIQFIPGPEATARWGLGYGDGAIYVLTRRSTKTPW
jgi:hypothetical protein